MIAVVLSHHADLVMLAQDSIFLARKKLRLVCLMEIVASTGAHVALFILYP